MLDEEVRVLGDERFSGTFGGTTAASYSMRHV